MKRKGEYVWVLGYMERDGHWHLASLLGLGLIPGHVRDHANENEQKYTETRMRWSVKKYVPAEGRR